MQHLVVANVAEFNRRQLDGVATGRELAVWDKGGADLEDMGLFWGGDGSTVVMSRSPDPLWVSDCQRWLGWEGISIKCPPATGPHVCDALLRDERAMEELVDRLKSQGGSVAVMSWGATEGLYRLVDGLCSRGVAIGAIDIPGREAFWIARHLETKSGFRQFAMAMEGQGTYFRLPRGFICGTPELALEAISHFHASGTSFVLKANDGTAGYSTISYGKQGLDRGRDWVVRDATRRMCFDSLWGRGCVVIEEMVTSDEGNPALPVTADFFVHESGEVSVSGCGTMLIRGRHLYAGVKCGLGALPDERVRDALNGIALAVGRELSRLGYAGWCDVDCLVPPAGPLYVNEINVRRASPSHAFSIGAAFGGPEWQETCAVYANDHMPLQGSCYPTYATLRQVFEKFNADRSTERRIAIPTLATTSLAGATPFLGYAVVAPTAARAGEMAKQLEAELRAAVGMGSDRHGGNRSS
jgi:hypothetical protein